MGIRQPAVAGRTVMVLALAVLAFGVTGGPANAANPELTPGAVFTETNNPAGNDVLVFARTADGTLEPPQSVATGGLGRAGNPPAGFPTLDASQAVELSSDGGTRRCLFAVNAGSNTVSSFQVRPHQLELADQESTNGIRPISVSGTDGGHILYVLNSDTSGWSLQGYRVSVACTLAPIVGGFSSSAATSLPAQVLFGEQGDFLLVSERFAAAGQGQIDVFPVDRQGALGAPIVNVSSGRSPYGMAFGHDDILAVSSEDFPAFLGSSVTTYRLNEDGTLTVLSGAASPGAACWNAFTANGRFLYATNPLGPLFGGTSISVLGVSKDGVLTPVASGQDTSHNAGDVALSHDGQYLYVGSDQLIPPSPNGAINEYRIDPETGALTPIGVMEAPGNGYTGPSSLVDRRAERVYQRLAAPVALIEAVRVLRAGGRIVLAPRTGTRSSLSQMTKS